MKRRTLISMAVSALVARVAHSSPIIDPVGPVANMHPRGELVAYSYADGFMTESPDGQRMTVYSGQIPDGWAYLPGFKAIDCKKPALSRWK